MASMPDKIHLITCSVWVYCLSQGREHGGHPPWDQAPLPPSSVNTSPCQYTWPPTCQIPKQSGRHHGGPYHLNGVLIFSFFCRDASNHPHWVVPMQGPSDLCKPWWGHWGLTAGLCLMWHGLLGHSSLCSCLTGSSGMWPWPSPTMGLWEGSSHTGSVGPAVATLSGSGLCQVCNGMIFTQLEGRMSSRTSLSKKVVSSSIFWWSSTMLSARQWGGSLGRKWVGPSLPSTEGPSHKLRSSGAGLSQKSWLPNCISGRGRNQESVLV